MKEKLTKNLGIKLLSLLLAAIMWIVIVNLDDPMTTREFKGVTVEILNQDDIQSLDKVYDIVEGGTVDITVRGKRSIVDSLKSTDIKATADLANRYIADPSAKTLNVHIESVCTKYTSSAVDVRITGAAQVLKISLEDIDTKQFKVTVQADGTVEDGYAISSITPKPNMVEVSGAKSQIAKIAEVRVYVDVLGLSDDFNTKVKPRVFDEEGKEIDSSKMTFNTSEITVTAKLLKTKTIPIYIKVTGTPAYGYQFVETDYEPKQLEIAADQETLDSLSSITIPVDVTGAIADVEQEVELAKFLPKDVIVANDVKTVTVKITVQKLITKEFIFTADDIQLKNLADGMKFNYVKAKDKYIVKVMGLEKDIEALTNNSLGAYIDLKDLVAGKNNITIQFSLDTSVSVVLSPTVEIELTANNENDNTNASPVPENTTLPEQTVDPLINPDTVG